MGVNVLIDLRETLKEEDFSQEKLANLIKSLPNDLAELKESLGFLATIIFSKDSAITPSLLSDKATPLYRRCFDAREIYLERDSSLDLLLMDFKEESTDSVEEMGNDDNQEDLENNVCVKLSEIMEFLLFCGANPGVVM